jgi:uncharacterized protein YndB with AHSA1/START domain
MSAPPEVVFSTATDPARRSAWLPGGAELDLDAEKLQARLTGGTDGLLAVREGDAGGSSVELTVGERSPEPEAVLRALERAVADNFNAG